ncbi:MAG: DUF1353 domain-containing protein [Bacteroidetes bacterium]|nr:DUF1353 domain-containing protein [Bacteroidota bacterium]
MAKLTYSEIINHHPLALNPADDGKHWILLEPFSYAVGTPDSDDVITVPMRFVTDFASIPRLVWFVFPPWGKYGKAAIVHDYLYSTGLKTRKESDSIFLEIMQVSCVDSLTRFLIHGFVRLFGWVFYKPNMKRVEKAVLKAQNHSASDISVIHCKPKKSDFWKTLVLVEFLLLSLAGTGYLLWKVLKPIFC